jgi:hypothetical protein
MWSWCSWAVPELAIAVAAFVTAVVFVVSRVVESATRIAPTNCVARTIVLPGACAATTPLPESIRTLRRHWSFASRRGRVRCRLTPGAAVLAHAPGRDRRSSVFRRIGHAEGRNPRGPHRSGGRDTGQRIPLNDRRIGTTPREVLRNRHLNASNGTGLPPEHPGGETDRLSVSEYGVWWRRHNAEKLRTQDRWIYRHIAAFEHAVTAPMKTAAMTRPQNIRPPRVSQRIYGSTVTTTFAW